MLFASSANAVPVFEERADAGRQLAARLPRYRGRRDTLVTGVTAGGVITAAATANALDLPLDVLVIGKLHPRGHHDVSLGSVGPDGVAVIDNDAVKGLHLSRSEVEIEVHRQQQEMRRLQRLYRGDRLPLDVTGKTVIVVDDGITSGATMDVAMAIIRRHHAARVVAAIPVAPALESRRLESEADEFICLQMPAPFRGVRHSYRNYQAVGDDRVVDVLGRAMRPAFL